LRVPSESRWPAASQVYATSPTAVKRLAASWLAFGYWRLAISLLC